MPLRILAVDDEPQVLEIIKAMMATAGCEVLTCQDSRRAAETIVEDKFDAILVDARMPDPDGFALTRAIRSSSVNHATPVVMLTGYDDAQTLREGFRAGITFFLGKPISHDRFARLFKVLSSAGWQEKRRSTRLPLRVAVRWRVGQKSSTATSADLSLGGMRLENAAGLELGQEAELEFSLPETPALLRMRARVMRKEPGGEVVVVFLECRPVEQEAISRYLGGQARS